MDSHSRNSYGTQFLINLFPQSLSTVLEVSGLVRGRSHSYSEVDAANPSQSTRLDRLNDDGPIEIMIIGDHDHVHDHTHGHDDHHQVTPLDINNPIRSGPGLPGGLPSGLPGLPLRVDSGSPLPSPRLGDEEAGLDQGTTRDGNARDTNTNTRYDVQPLTRWLEQVLPFTVLLLLVFIRQHLQGLAVTFWIIAVMLIANDVLRKQTALKTERKKWRTLMIACSLMLQNVGVYMLFRRDGLWRPLVLLPPRKIPKFWQAIFTIVVNDVMVRKMGMVIKCVVLLTHKGSRGRHFRRQGQFLTLVEYLLLLYRALIPAPVWYRFFLNKEYGTMFSSLTTGLYLTFKLTSVFEKAQEFFTSARILTRSEVQYGARATVEEVLAAGDLCAICQSKMHSPISLRCKHVFCEDCISEWFERERTCPLCRAVVKSAELRSFADGSTSLSMQIF